jgi:cytochrome c biogenesis protein CcmG, thiol:disulfide interchange protein DsbE
MRPLTITVRTPIACRETEPIRERRSLLRGSARLAAAAALTGFVPASPPARAAASGLTVWQDTALEKAGGVLDLEGRPVELTAMRGRVLVVNLWATWCGPCREEMPSLARLQQAFQGKPLEVLAVSLGDSVNKIEQFMVHVPEVPRLLRHPTGALGQAWRVRLLPATFVFDAQGACRYRELGAREWDAPEVVAGLSALLPA